MHSIDYAAPQGRSHAPQAAGRAPASIGHLSVSHPPQSLKMHSGVYYKTNLFIFTAPGS